MVESNLKRISLAVIGIIFGLGFILGKNGCLVVTGGGGFSCYWFGLPFGSFAFVAILALIIFIISIIFMIIFLIKETSNLNRIIIILSILSTLILIILNYVSKLPQPLNPM